MAKVLSPSTVASGALFTHDLPIGGVEWLTIIGAVLAAGAAADVSTNVVPYTDDADASPGLLTGLLLPVDSTAAAVLTNGVAYIMNRYKVSGIRKVQIQVKNNNVAAKSVELDYFTG